MESIEEQKKAYKKAYAWALKVQKACLLKPVDINVGADYCKANDVDYEISGYSIVVDIWDDDLKEHIVARWATYYHDFEEKKAVVEAYLKGKGITIK